MTFREGWREVPRKALLGMEVKKEHLAKYTEPRRCSGSQGTCPCAPCALLPGTVCRASSLSPALPWGAVTEPCVTDTAQAGSQCSTGLSHSRDGEHVPGQTSHPHVLCKEELSSAPLFNFTGSSSKKTGFKLEVIVEMWCLKIKHFRNTTLSRGLSC